MVWYVVWCVGVECPTRQNVLVGAQETVETGKEQRRRVRGRGAEKKSNIFYPLFLFPLSPFSLCLPSFCLLSLSSLVSFFLSFPSLSPLSPLPVTVVGVFSPPLSNDDYLPLSFLTKDKDRSIDVVTTDKKVHQVRARVSHDTYCHVCRTVSHDC